MFLKGLASSRHLTLAVHLQHTKGCVCQLEVTNSTEEETQQPATAQQVQDWQGTLDAPYTFWTNLEKYGTVWGSKEILEASLGSRRGTEKKNKKVMNKVDFIMIIQEFPASGTRRFSN